MNGEEMKSEAAHASNDSQKRDDVFAATPETSFARFIISNAATDEDAAVLISDISVAFMHARMDEELVVTPPPGIVTSKFWRIKAAVNGAQRASQLWQEHSASKLMEKDWIRNDVNPCIFWHKELNF